MPGPLLNHVRQKCFDEPYWRQRVDAVRELDFLVGNIDDLSSGDNASVVDKNINGTKLFERLCSGSRRYKCVIRPKRRR